MEAPSSKKDYIICGTEFVLENGDKKDFIRRNLYSGKDAGRDSRNHLNYFMRHLDFVSCPVEPYVWTRPAKNSDGSSYNEYALI